jgi:hypothetical protein
MKTLANLLAAALLAGLMSVTASAADLGPALAKLQAVGPAGKGHREAAEAWRELARADAAQLATLLAALDQAGPLAANWIRTAVDAVAERTLQSGGTLPASELEKFVRDRRHAPRARRLAYEWLRRVDPTAAERLIPDALDDPSLEMRRDAVARLMNKASALADPKRKADAVALYRKALTAARDTDQMTLAAQRLRSLDQTVDLARQFGFIVVWKVIGPFDNAEDKGSDQGYDAVYPPETGLDFASSCRGLHGVVRWIDYTTTDDYGNVDLNAALGVEKSVAGYATAEFLAAGRREVEIRIASDNAIKVWLNGKLIDRRHVYHGGSQLDQYVIPVVLQPGRNVILVKVCQNAQTQDWARSWGFQLRVCDRWGAAVLSGDRPGKGVQRESR